MDEQLILATHIYDGRSGALCYVEQMMEQRFKTHIELVRARTNFQTK